MAEPEDVPKENDRVGLNDIGAFDTDLYTGSKSKFEGYHTSLALAEEEEEDDPMAGQAPKRQTYTGKCFIISENCVVLQCYSYSEVNNDTLNGISVSCYFQLKSEHIQAVLIVF